MEGVEGMAEGDTKEVLVEAKRTVDLTAQLLQVTLAGLNFTAADITIAQAAVTLQQNQINQTLFLL